MSIPHRRLGLNQNARGTGKYYYAKLNCPELLRRVIYYSKTYGTRCAEEALGLASDDVGRTCGFKRFLSHECC